MSVSGSVSKHASERRLREEGEVNCECLRAHFRREGKLQVAHVYALIKRAAALFRAQPNLLSLRGPTTGELDTCA
jgi:hypothetical protein